MIPSRNAIHHLIFHMKENALVNLKVGVRRNAKIMAKRVAKVTIEITSQVVDATHTHLPRAKDTITHLRRDGKTQTVSIQTATEGAAINHLPFHVRHIGKKLRRSLACKAKKHQTKRCNYCETFHNS